MISKLLAATDGSEVALKASRYSVQLAKQLGASITILSVIDNRNFPASYAVPPEATTSISRNQWRISSKKWLEGM
jgi:nucleotide-binding universal stress UspA family protein